MLLTRNGQVVPGSQRLSGTNRVPAFLSVLVIAAGAACAGGTSEPDRTTPAHLLPPIHAQVYGPAAQAADRPISAAKDRLIATCMARKGFSYDTKRPEETAEPGRPTPFSFESRKRSVGAKTNPPLEKPGAVGKNYVLALHGRQDDRILVQGRGMQVSLPARGCVAYAETRILGDKRIRWSEIRMKLGEAETQAQQLLESLPSFRNLNSRWARCMKDAGHSFSTPIQLRDALPRKADIINDPRVVSDVACKRKTGYLRFAYEGLAQAQRKVLGDDGRLLAEWDSLVRQQKRTAQRVLSTEEHRVSN
ncbi:hypothetical protein [Streptomyces aureoverticillatus]|uniref:hypothetical protein n=1 Tax=Streptomyces aureoverticillatus TaxID=66871 RepID=UPI0013DCB6D6|nr:hypothetical protein [Streptomyces aureoverticillatus]QIB47773.1 hypothetical protein G3H79_36545 [Streptomyces aureoverticillatus]